MLFVSLSLLAKACKLAATASGGSQLSNQHSIALSEILNRLGRWGWSKIAPGSDSWRGKDDSSIVRHTSERIMSNWYCSAKIGCIEMCWVKNWRQNLHVFYMITSYYISHVFIAHGTWRSTFLLRWSHQWLKWLMVHLPAYEMISGVRSLGKFVRFVEFGPGLKAWRCLVM